MCIKHGRRRIHRAAEQSGPQLLRADALATGEIRKKNIRTVFSRVFVPLKSVRNKNLVDENTIEILTNARETITNRFLNIPRTVTNAIIFQKYRHFK